MQILNKLIDNQNNKNNKICPGISDLVDVLYTSELNEFIQKKCSNIDDKRTFLMFIIMYFCSYLSLDDNMNNKQNMKILLSNLLLNPENRKKCIDLYLKFESSIKMINN